MTRTPAWTDHEIDAVINLYFVMTAAVDAGQPYNKAKLIREAQSSGQNVGIPNGYHGELVARSRGSIEAKLMNVTACLNYLKFAGTTMESHGYVPLANYQKALFERVKALLDTLTPAGIIKVTAA